MTKEQLIEWLMKKGYEEDRYGNFKKPHNGYHIRFKLNPRKARYEVKCKDGRWRRRMSGFYTSLRITNDGRLAGLKK